MILLNCNDLEKKIIEYQDNPDLVSEEELATMRRNCPELEQNIAIIEDWKKEDAVFFSLFAEARSVALPFNVKIPQKKNSRPGMMWLGIPAAALVLFAVSLVFIRESAESSHQAVVSEFSEANVTPEKTKESSTPEFATIAKVSPPVQKTAKSGASSSASTIQEQEPVAAMQEQAAMMAMGLPSERSAKAVPVSEEEALWEQLTLDPSNEAVRKKLRKILEDKKDSEGLRRLDSLR